MQPDASMGITTFLSQVCATGIFVQTAAFLKKTFFAVVCPNEFSTMALF